MDLNPDNDGPDDGPADGPDHAARTHVAVENHSSFGTWVSGADTKASFAAAVIAVFVAALASQASTIGGLAECQKAVAVLARIAAIVTVGAVVVTAGFLGAVQWPRLSCREPNPYAWPSVAKHSLDDLMAKVDDPAQRSIVAWRQAQILARIARSKHRTFRFALAALFAAGISFVAWGTLTTLATTACAQG